MDDEHEEGNYMFYTLSDFMKLKTEVCRRQRLV